MIKILILLLVLLSGCAYFNTIRYDESFSSIPTEPQKVKILPTLPQEKFTVLGEIKCSAAPASNWNSLYSRLKEEAAKLGGDAIIVNAGTQYGGTYTTLGTSTTTGSASAYGLGNSVYVQGSSQTTNYPGYSIPVYKKEINALVIKFNNNQK